MGRMTLFVVHSLIRIKAKQNNIVYITLKVLFSCFTKIYAVYKIIRQQHPVKAI